MTLYDVLGVSQDASETEIRRQYQELARQFHPDKSDTDSAKEKFLKVTEAWHVLGDTQKRREYDDQLKREKVRHHYVQCVHTVCYNWVLSELVYGTLNFSYHMASGKVMVAFKFIAG